jgi:predicted SAM-dependent methyltransferase
MEAHQQNGVDPQLPSAAPALVIESARPLELEPPTKLRRFDLACGQRCTPGFEGVDLHAAAEHKVDLCKFPWPFPDDCADELVCSHFVEHIPAREVEARDLVDPNPQTLDRWLGVDMLFAFFDEAHRVLRPGGKMRVVVPSLKNERAFQDPTHRRFIPMATFLYLSREWLKVQGLDHYRTRANFGVNVAPTIPSELGLLSPEAQQRRFTESWNTTIDLIADLVAIKP